MASNLELLWISNAIPDIAIALDAGIDWIFLDIERDGKETRQPSGSFISDHSMNDVDRVRAAFPQARLLLRINPLNPTTKDEINQAIDAGIDAVMLPFFKTNQELEQVVSLIGDRCEFWPLVETVEACEMTARGEMLDKGIDRIHIGLNDLHLQLGSRFMFTPLLDSRVDSAIEYLKCNGRRFGIGGVSAMDSGLLPGADVLSLHHCLGSSAVILSQDFRRIVASGGLSFEVGRLRNHWEALCNAGECLTDCKASVLDSIRMLEFGEV